MPDNNSSELNNSIHALLCVLCYNLHVSFAGTIGKVETNAVKSTLRYRFGDDGGISMTNYELFMAMLAVAGIVIALIRK